jgi:hypothetical protein
VTSILQMQCSYAGRIYRLPWGSQHIRRTYIPTDPDGSEVSHGELTGTCEGWRAARVHMRVSHLQLDI